MSRNVDYDYENEESIDINLKCSICDEAMIDPVILAPSLDMYTHLQSLDLYGNSITDEDVEYLSNMLQLNRPLSVLKLGFSNITNKGLKILANAIVNYNRNLKHLSLFGNKLINNS
ncbi:unnamed protein product [Rotaria sp. Silwood2]|nr:unnamed protein product [Rotaria sp. Silwood2]CAF4281971.1 unnamed protein product [Rotaria sp. Silwood2]CAF4644825.1 unnamed protein product [Rotaria sp. Silwood2]